MEELVKALLEAPDKFKSAIIWSARVVMGMILASAIYVKLFGAYHLITLTDWPQWVEFLLSGRVFICLLIYVLADQFLFGLLNLLSIPFFRGTSRLFYKLWAGTKGMKSVIRTMLRFAELLDIDDKSGQIKLMDRSESLYDELVLLNRKEGRIDMVSQKDSFLSDIGHTVFAFAFVYFFLMPAYPHHMLLSTVVVIALFAVAATYAGLQLFFEFIKKAGPELAEMIAWAKMREFVISIFMESDLFIHEREFRNGETHTCFYFYGKYVLLDFQFDRKKCRLYRVEKAAKSAEQVGAFTIVIANRPVDADAIQYSIDNGIWMQLVQVVSEDDAKEKIIALIKEKFSKPVEVLFNEEIDELKQ